MTCAASRAVVTTRSVSRLLRCAQVAASKKASAPAKSGSGLQQPQTPQQQPPHARSPTSKEEDSPSAPASSSPGAEQRSLAAARVSVHRATQPHQQPNSMLPTAAAFQPAGSAGAHAQKPFETVSLQAGGAVSAGAVHVAPSSPGIEAAGPSTTSRSTTRCRGYYPPVEVSVAAPPPPPPPRPVQQQRPRPAYAPHSHAGGHAQQPQHRGAPRAAPAAGQAPRPAQRQQQKYSPPSLAQATQQQQQQQQQQKPLLETTQPHQQQRQQSLLSEEEAVAQALQLSAGRSLAWYCATCTYRHEGAEANYLSCAVCTAAKPPT